MNSADPAPEPARRTITLTLPSGPLFLWAAGGALAALVFFAAVGGVGWMAWLLWQNSQRQAAAQTDYRTQFETAAIALESGLQRAEAEAARLEAGLKDAMRATRASSIVLPRYESDASLLERDAATTRSGLDALRSLEASVRRTHGLDDRIGLADAASQARLAALSTRSAALDRRLDGTRGELAQVAAHRSSLAARESAAARERQWAASRALARERARRESAWVAPSFGWAAPVYARPSWHLTPYWSSFGYTGHRRWHGHHPAYGYGDCGRRYRHGGGVGFSIVFR